jgi:hypothetical protein
MDVAAPKLYDFPDASTTKSFNTLHAALIPGRRGSLLCWRSMNFKN